MPIVEFNRPDGGRCSGYRAEPVSKRGGGGLVILHELWGLSPTMERIADEFAGEGYRTLVPDLFQGRRAHDVNEGFALMGGVDVADAVAQNIRGAVQLLEQEGCSVAVLGFCFGGLLALVAAARIPELAAAVCCYGIPSPDVEDPANISIPLLCHFASEDEWCTPAKVDQLERRLREGGVNFELYRYDARHAFMNRDGKTFSAAATELAMLRTREFLARTLRT